MELEIAHSDLSLSCRGGSSVLVFGHKAKVSFADEGWIGEVCSGQGLNPAASGYAAGARIKNHDKLKDFLSPISATVSDGYTDAKNSCFGKGVRRRCWACWIQEGRF